MENCGIITKGRRHTDCHIDGIQLKLKTTCQKYAVLYESIQQIDKDEKTSISSYPFKC